MSAQDKTASSLTIKSTVRVSSGFTIPAIGLGVYKNNDPQPACLAALAHGYRHIDSAQMYRNEKQVGEAVRNSGVPRSQVFLTSKINRLDGGYDGTLEAVDDSLKNFGTDSIDLYLIHSPLAGKEKRLAAWKALLAARDAKKIRTVGVSNYGVKHLEEIHAAGLETSAVNQIELHPLCQQRDIVDWCRKKRKDPAQVLVRWSLQHGFVALPKSSNPDRVRSNAQVYDFELSKEDMEELDAQDKGKEGSISWNPVDAD